ncbi:Copia protein [Frankliniella fusca]|uniref:Copia protein n=1 Tax=Frankliniella fusca TaxID=407009 RepID=A0AAE1H9I5_9NEOP|nr:Copia protein [Frankliniella fusca]
MVDVALSHLSLVLHVKWNEAVEYICIRIVMKPIKIYWGQSPLMKHIASVFGWVGDDKF